MKHKKPIITWLIITNTTEAHLYEIIEKKFSQIQSLEHPESRLKSIDITSDRPGHYMTGHTTHGQFSKTTDPHHEEHDHFAKIVADLLNQGKQKNQYQALIICAEPRFYGLINQHLHDVVSDSISTVIEKDYIPLPKYKRDEIIHQIVHEMKSK